ncbi:MAG: prepilin-type N-terminal cleavage/methylation protein [Rickettsiaceae bacterium]|jgi:type II secretory pathway component PulJ|nr:prepilin-type N-terminal cleavage/methylation protein [Rickettsiaceae bacterium]
MSRVKSQGFSILELTISITIIALIVAAITAASNMKSKLELNQVVDDIGNTSSGLKVFKTTYNGIPGDLVNAEDAFGVTSTDSGNGNNFLGTTDGSGTNKNETLLFWQHLSLAGLIEGSYDGITNGVGGRMEAPVKRGLYGAIKTSGHSLLGNSLNISVGKASDYGLFTTKQAYNYDTKYDDGTPNTGTIRAADGTGETAQACVTTGSPQTYTLTNSSGTPCIIFFAIDQ